MKKHLVLIVVACITVIAVFFYLAQVNKGDINSQKRAQIKIASQLASKGTNLNTGIISEINYK
ncbi:hypothetical protein IA623_07390 [Listeria seeligeri]|uniref:hypothetical protein n=1 Tax=Listeria seeligeri TaxID=1640 RepID=UPI0016259D51|nr:hypothetical protein [Listeria seeligeri]MBC1734391.1 hypothetical protein [Listeria seeligeri]MBF2365226.1 hypothetical protein [Listeria seeligeri]MBF2539137.1 hypothetical protein [Listeria seeligeri]MBF2585300.1 hypothetical protein [Listeria seeligeri]MBF2605302.1 hypothetical protein [Listeria seeligeri]